MGRISALILAIGIALAGVSVGTGLQQFRLGERSVTIKGLAERDMKSDFAVWTLTFRRGGDQFGTVQQALTDDRTRVADFLRAQGFREDELEISAVQVQDAYAREYAQSNVPLRYNGAGQVSVKSERVDAVAAAANAIDPLIAAGIQLTGEGEGQGLPRYQLRGVNELKPALLEAATQNALEQAQKFAADAGATLGHLKNANQGVIRVLADDGNHDAGRTIDKRVRLVSTFVYMLE